MTPRIVFHLPRSWLGPAGSGVLPAAAFSGAAVHAPRPPLIAIGAFLDYYAALRQRAGRLDVV